MMPILSNVLRLPERNVTHVNINDAQILYSLYDFKELLGKGAYGTVVRCVEKKTTHDWAVKIIHKSNIGSRLANLELEIKILKCVDHPNIIRLEKVFESPKKYYLMFEKCKSNLQTPFEENKPFTEKLTKKILVQLISALSYLHKRGIIHRDVKLQNILVTTNPNNATDNYFIKLTDFGLSIIKQGFGSTFLNEVCGTVLYMAPEIVEKECYTEACDIWAAGVLVYLLLFASFPFEAKSDEELLRRICQTEPSYGPRKISEEASNLLHLMLMKNPVSRISIPFIQDHPWISSGARESIYGGTGNIINFMKKWREETGSVVTAIADEDEWETKIESILVEYEPQDNKTKASSTLKNSLKCFKMRK